MATKSKMMVVAAIVALVWVGRSAARAADERGWAMSKVQRVKAVELPAWNTGIAFEENSVLFEGVLSIERCDSRELKGVMRAGRFSVWNATVQFGKDEKRALPQTKSRGRHVLARLRVPNAKLDVRLLRRIAESGEENKRVHDVQGSDGCELVDWRDFGGAVNEHMIICSADFQARQTSAADDWKQFIQDCIGKTEALCEQQGVEEDGVSFGQEDEYLVEVSDYEQGVYRVVRVAALHTAAYRRMPPRCHIDKQYIGVGVSEIFLAAAYEFDGAGDVERLRIMGPKAACGEEIKCAHD